MRGRVYIVGAGPGDPGLITVRGLALLRVADAVVYDRLVHPALLGEAPPHALRLEMGRTPGHGGPSPEEVAGALARLAREGKRVVRLKGGDPFIFGRGGEEAEALARAGVPFEVVPGVTAAVAVPAYAGVPITHRDLASSFVVVTGHRACGGKPPVDWDALARLGGTIVVLMAVATLEEVTARLVSAGRPGSTPALMVEWGTLPRQRVVQGTLVDIATRAREAGLHPPATLVVGEVVRLRERLAWFDRGPLFGRRIGLPHHLSPLAPWLEGAGAEPVPLTGDGLHTRGLDALVVASPAQVRRLARTGGQEGPAFPRLVYLGEGTACLARSLGLPVDAISPTPHPPAVVEALALALCGGVVAGKGLDTEDGK